MKQTNPTIVQRLIGKFPSKIKRIIFGILVFQTCLNGKASAKQLGELNSELDLAADPRALELPALWWRSFDVFDYNQRKALLGLLVNPEAESSGLVAITKAMPTWIRYAEPEQMAVDVARVLKHAHHTN